MLLRFGLQELRWCRWYIVPLLLHLTRATFGRYMTTSIRSIKCLPSILPYAHQSLLVRVFGEDSLEVIEFHV